MKNMIKKLFRQNEKPVKSNEFVEYMHELLEEEREPAYQAHIDNYVKNEVENIKIQIFKHIRRSCKLHANLPEKEKNSIIPEYFFTLKLQLGEYSLYRGIETSCDDRNIIGEIFAARAHLVRDALTKDGITNIITYAHKALDDKTQKFNVHVCWWPEPKQAEAMIRNRYEIIK